MSNSVELANSNSTNPTNANPSNNDEIISQLRTYTNADIPLFSLDQQNKICKVVDVYDADTCKIIFQLDGKIDSKQLKESIKLAREACKEIHDLQKNVLKSL